MIYELQIIFNNIGERKENRGRREIKKLPSYEESFLFLGIVVSVKQETA
jgi:hypothetical protein